MVAYRILFLAGAVAALPLNINLGAYSPALVVGDGEISFGGNQDVSGLMSVLEGAAVNAANGAAANGAAQGAEAQRPAAAAAAPAAAAAAATPATGQTTAASTSSSLEQNQAIQPLAVPATDASASSVDPTLTEQAQQIAALQGMGKAVLPRDETSEETPNVAKRDLASFDRALKYAEAALVKGPKIQLGTGEGGSGVGLIVDNNQQAAARPGTGAAAKRDVAASQKVKVTTMYVRSGIPASLQNGGQMTARDLSDGLDVEPRSYETIQIAPGKRDPNAAPNAIDAVNLNVNGQQGVTMTFVETVEDGEDDA